MAKRSFQVPTWTTSPLADTTALTNGAHLSIGASAATAGLNVIEIYIGGQASASTVAIMQFARNSVIGASLTALAAPASDGPLNTLTAASQVGSLTYTAAGTPPQRSATTTSARLNLSLNAFGGIVRWVAAPGEEFGIVGVTASISECSLSAFTGGGAALLGSHIVYEPF